MNAARCFVFGIGVGTAAGLLLAPRTGVKMRRAIADSAKDGQKYIKNMTNTVTDTLDRTVNAAKAMGSGIETAFENAKQELVG